MRIPFRKRSSDDRQRRALEKARKMAAGTDRVLHLTPPEGVSLDLKLASMGQRLGAQVTDFMVTMVAAIIIVILIAYISSGSTAFFQVVAALIFFFIRVPYYILTELVWNGRTLAKRWLGMRVVSVNGRSLTPHQVVVRNIMKEVEFFAPLTYVFAGNFIHWSLTVMALLWIVVLLFVPWRNKLNQRIGDIIANTAVINDPQPVLLRDLAGSELPGQTLAPQERFAFTTGQLDHYGKLELQVLERVLRAPANTTPSSQKKQAEYVADIVGRITQKIAYPERIETAEHREFLNAFYRAQRAHLESRKLFGDAREDKFFREDNETETAKQ